MMANIKEKCVHSAPGDMNKSSTYFETMFTIANGIAIDKILSVKSSDQ